jgi:F1F0 ATPase subunit 2
MTASIQLLLAFLGGLAAGWVFFYGLHRTVRALPGSERPALLLIVSLLLRMGLLLGAGWLLFRLGGGLEHLLAAFIGVMLVRFLLLRRLGRGRTESEDRST